MKLFSYPFIADENIHPAVVGRQDASELNFMIDVIMKRHGIRAGLPPNKAAKTLQEEIRLDSIQYFSQVKLWQTSLKKTSYLN